MRVANVVKPARDTRSPAAPAPPGAGLIQEWEGAWRQPRGNRAEKWAGRERIGSVCVGVLPPADSLAVVGQW